MAMPDTTPAAEAVRLAALRRMDPAARLRQVFDLSEWARSLALVRLRQVHPDQTELELVERVLGRTLVPRAPHAPGR
jgi:hypothetical protein